MVTLKTEAIITLTQHKELLTQEIRSNLVSAFEQVSSWAAVTRLYRTSDSLRVTGYGIGCQVVLLHGQQSMDNRPYFGCLRYKSPQYHPGEYFVLTCLTSLASSAPAVSNLVVDLGYAKYRGKAEPATGWVIVQDLLHDSVPCEARHVPAYVWPVRMSLFLRPYRTNSRHGIRYAANASREYRFRAPRPVEHFGSFDPTQIIDATSAGPSAFNATPAGHSATRWISWL